MKKNKTSVLFILKITKKHQNGFYLINSYIAESEKIQTYFNSSFLVMHSPEIRFRILRVLVSILKSVNDFFRLAFIIIKNKPELVYFPISPVYSFLRDIIFVFLLKSITDTKIVYHLHGKGIKKKYNSGKIYKHLYNYAYFGVHVICLSEKLTYDISYLPIKKHWIVPNAIPNNDYVFQRKLKSKTIQLLFLSNLIISKGVLDFIKSLKILVDEGHDIQGLIVGKERELTASEIKMNIGNYKEHIRYIGPKYGINKFSILKDSDIFVFPTYYETETWGIVILEAMQMGLPVIATNEGAITDMITNGINGYIVNKHDPKDIADKASILIHNPELRTSMGERNRTLFQNKFTMNHFERNLVQVLDNIIYY